MQGKCQASTSTNLLLNHPDLVKYHFLMSQNAVTSICIELPFFKSLLISGQIRVEYVAHFAMHNCVAAIFFKWKSFTEDVTRENACCQVTCFQNSACVYMQLLISWNRAHFRFRRKMGFLFGPAPIRRTLPYLKNGVLHFRDRVKVMEVHFNMYWKNRQADKSHIPHPQHDAHLGLRLELSFSLTTFWPFTIYLLF